MSLHYLVKGRCSKFLPDTGFLSCVAQIWCQSEEGILSRQLSWLDMMMMTIEATAKHLQVV